MKAVFWTTLQLCVSLVYADRASTSGEFLNLLAATKEAPPNSTRRLLLLDQLGRIASDNRTDANFVGVISEEGSRSLSGIIRGGGTHWYEAIRIAECLRSDEIAAAILDSMSLAPSVDEDAIERALSSCAGTGSLRRLISVAQSPSSGVSRKRVATAVIGAMLVRGISNSDSTVADEFVRACQDLGADQHGRATSIVSRCSDMIGSLRAADDASPAVRIEARRALGGWGIPVSVGDRISDSPQIWLNAYDAIEALVTRECRDYLGVGLAGAGGS